MNGNSYTSNYIGSSEATGIANYPKPVPVSPVDEAISLVVGAQSRTFDLLNLLESKLEKALTPPSPEGKGDGDARPGSATALLQAIDGRRDTAEAINNRLSYILERIAL